MEVTCLGEGRARIPDDPDIHPAEREDGGERTDVQPQRDDRQCPERGREVAASKQTPLIEAVREPSGQERTSGARC